MKKSLLSLLLLLTTTVLIADDKTYSGLYVYGHETHSFQPCDGEVYWVDATKWVIDPLQKFYKEETKEAYQSVFVTLRGHFHDEVLNGFAANYQGIFHISEVYLFSSVVPDTCRPQESNTTTEAK